MQYEKWYSSRAIIQWITSPQQISPPNMAVFRIQQAYCLKPLTADKTAKTLIFFQSNEVSYFLKVIH